MTRKSLLKFLIYPFAHIRAKILANLIQEYIPSKSLVLDIGCGNMLISKVLRDRIGICVRGIDVIDMNLTNSPHQIFDGKKIPFSGNSFDVSLLIGVLHHVEDQQILLEEAKRVTGGRVIIFEDVYFSEVEKIWIRIRDVLGNLPEGVKINFALNFHNTVEWERIFNEHRFKVVYSEGFFNFLRFTHHVFYILENSEN